MLIDEEILHAFSAMRSDREIIVGLSISLTGRFGPQGRQALQGIQLWESYINGRGGIDLGAEGRRHLRVIYYDDRSWVSRARENTLRLIREDHVHSLFGPYSSALTLAAAAVAEEHRKILWNHGGSSDAIFKHGFHCLVSIASPASDYLRGLPPWLARHSPALRRLCAVHSTRGTFAAQVVCGAVEAAEALGFPAVELVPLSSPLINIDNVVQKLASIRPEVLILAGSFEDELQIMQASHLWRGSVQQVAAVAAGVQAFYRELRQSAEGVIGPSQWEPEVSFADAQEPEASWFVAKFQEQFGQLPDYTAAGGFAMGLVWAECVRRAVPVEDEILRTVAAELDFHTLYGRFRIDPKSGRQIGHRILLTRWQQGRKVVLAT